MEFNVNKPRVVIQYPFIPLYRIPVFRKLAESDKYDYIYWAGMQSPDKYLRSAFAESGLPLEEVPLQTIRIPIVKKVLEFQFSAIWKLIKNRPDVYIILANPNSISSWMCMLAARLMGCVVLAWSHGFLSDENSFKNKLRKLYYRIPHGHLLYGNKAKEIMIKRGFNRDKLDVIYNSLDYEKQAVLREKQDKERRASVRKDLNIPETGILLIAIGRLMSKLKIDQAIEGIKCLNNQQKNVYLLVIGDGPERENLTKKAEALGISDKVIFYGACHNEEILSQLFNAADICVVMGKVGLSAMHALGYGIPLVTNNNLDKHFPEIEAITENETGWFFAEDDIESFANMIKPVEYRGECYKKCIKVIEDRYTPAKQSKLIENAIAKYL